MARGYMSTGTLRFLGMQPPLTEVRSSSDCTVGTCLPNARFRVQRFGSVSRHALA